VEGHNNKSDSSPMPSKASATPQTPKGTRLLPRRVPTLSLLMILEQEPQ
jgi:hypothetical protein